MGKIMKHCIIVKFVDGFNWKNNLDDIKSIFDKTTEIKGITKVDYLLTNTDIENRSHLAIVITMDKKALEAYKVSSYHLLWKEKYSQYILNKTIFDFDE